MMKNNILFDNADENEGMPAFFVPSVAVAQTPVTPQLPAQQPVIQPQVGAMTTPVQHVQSPVPSVVAPPLFNPSSAFAQPMTQSKKPSRYAATPGITAIGAPSSLTPPTMNMPPTPTLTPQTSVSNTQRSPHTYNPLPPATFPSQPTMSPTLTPIESVATSPPPIHSPPTPVEQVKHYWFFHTRNESSGGDMWMPLSKIDSINLEKAFDSGSIDPIPICGGRYTADLMKGTRSPIYWTEDEEVRLRRGSWYASTGTGFQPLSEEACDVIDYNYQQGQFPVKFDTTEGACVIHNHYSCVLVPPGCTPDEYGVVPEGQPRPQLVKGQITEEDLGITMPLDEDQGPAHALVLVACGGSSGKRSVNNVDLMRTRLLQMKQSKFPHDQKVDILPVHWHQAHTEQAVGATETLNGLTLGSVKRLREFTNTSMMDVLFYTSPIYAQPMVESLVTQVEDMITLYKEKNPNFNGKIAFIGHGISSLILFDLLSNQGGTASAPPPVATVEAKSVSEAGLSATRDVGSLEQLLEKLSIESIRPKLDQEQIDLESLLLLNEDELKELAIPLGPRKKLLAFIKNEASQPIMVPTPDVPDLGALCIEEGMDVNVQYRQYDTGVGSPKISYPKLSFDPFALFGLGAPIGLLLALRGVEHLGGDYVLPTCHKFLNIFHPYDPFAYRLEPYILDYGVSPPKPVQIPHHAGRKRLHLEIADNLGKAAEAAKAGLLRSMRSVMSSVKRAAGYEEAEQAEQIANEMFQQHKQRRDSEASSTKDDNMEIGALNSGKRIDYQLQERPLEMFNEYMFAFQSHTGYWASEDVALLLLRQIYEKDPNIFISE